MTLAEIIAAIIAAQVEGAKPFDAEAAFNTLMAEKLEGVNNKNTELLGKLKNSKLITDALPEGFTPEKWDEMTKALEGVDLSKLSTPEQVEAVTRNLAESHSKETEKWTARESMLMAALQKHLVDSKVTAAVTTAHGNSTLLAPHISQKIKMVEEDGEFRAIVVDDKGTERFSLVKAGERMGIDELVAEYKVNDTYASAFDAGNGGGGGGGSKVTGVANPFKKGDPAYSLSEQGRMMNEQPTVAAGLKAAAEAETGKAATA